MRKVPGQWSVLPPGGLGGRSRRVLRWGDLEDAEHVGRHDAEETTGADDAARELELRSGLPIEKQAAPPIACPLASDLFLSLRRHDDEPRS